jgi:hypothetical protein
LEGFALFSEAVMGEFLFAFEVWGVGEDVHLLGVPSVVVAAAVF